MLSTTESTRGTTPVPAVDRPTRAAGRRLVGLVGGIGLLAVAATASIAIGSRALGLGEVWDALWSAQGTADTVGIVRDLRVPRTLLGLLVGLAMGAAGALTQAHTRNPLADPGLLGVNAGAACAVVVGVYALGITTPMQYMGFGLLGAVLAAAAVFGASAATKGASPITLVLAGTGLSALLLAITSGIVLIDTASLDAWRFWNVGSIVGRGTDVIWAALPFVVAGLVLAIGSGFFLNVLGLGDDMSRALGSRVVTVRIVGILAITVLSGLEVDELVAAIAKGDVARLTKIHGVGKKTAERLVLELKEKAKLMGSAASPGTKPAKAAKSPKSDLVSALVNLGYKEAQAEQASQKAEESAGADAAFEVLFREALKALRS